MQSTRSDLSILINHLCLSGHPQARKRILETLERDVVCKPRPAGDEDHYADYMEFMRKENLPGTTEEVLLEQTRSHVLGLMFAGHETAANVMLFAVKYISENPRVLDELRVSSHPLKLAFDNCT